MARRSDRVVRLVASERETPLAQLGTGPLLCVRCQHLDVPLLSRGETPRVVEAAAVAVAATAAAALAVRTMQRQCRGDCVGGGAALLGQVLKLPHLQAQSGGRQNRGTRRVGGQLTFS